MEDMKLTPLSELVDETWGEIGTPERDMMESQLKEELHAYYVGEAIKKARQARHLTQEQLGEKIGVHSLLIMQKKSNREKSKVRNRVGHVFGFIERSMGELVVRSVSMARAKANVAMTNLTYNIARLSQIFRYLKDWIAVSK